MCQRIVRMKEVQVWKASHTGAGTWEELCTNIKQTEKQNKTKQELLREPELGGGDQS